MAHTKKTVRAQRTKAVGQVGERIVKAFRAFGAKVHQRSLNTFLMVVLTGIGVYIAYTANGIAEFQTDTMIMQSTIIQSQSAPLLAFDTTPTLRAMAEQKHDSDSVDATRSIEVSNVGASVVNLVCDPITFIEVQIADQGDRGPLTAILPVESFYTTPAFFGATSHGTGHLLTIQGLENNQGRLYALTDAVEGLAKSRGQDAHTLFATFVRTEFTNTMSAQENRLYFVGMFGVARVDADYAGELLLLYQDRVRNKAVLDLDTATPEDVLAYAKSVIDRTGGDEPLETYDSLMPPPYKDPDADLDEWSESFYQEPYWYWGRDDESAGLQFGSSVR